jgi:hypothetical protein
LIGLGLDGIGRCQVIEELVEVDRKSEEVCQRIRERWDEEGCVQLRMLGRGKLKIQMTLRLVAVTSTVEVRMQKRTANKRILARCLDLCQTAFN